jgi:PhoD-like phosphatase
MSSSTTPTSLPFVLGPVVGEMSLDGSVVLLYSITEQLTLYILAVDDVPVQIITCPPTYPAELKPYRLQIDGLVAGVAYSLQWKRKIDDEEPVYTHNIRMLSPDTSPNVFVISCNRPNHSNGTNLWAHMHNDMTVGDVLVHAGDQVYTDPIVIPFIASAAHRLTFGMVRPKLPPYELVYSKIAQLYQTNWMMPATRRVLSTVCNLMIKDDHEIVDDRIQIKYAHSPVFALTKRAAMQAYHDFQLALRLNPPLYPLLDDADPPMSYSVMVGGGAGVHLVDSTLQGFDREASISVPIFLATPGLKRAVIACGVIPLAVLAKPSALYLFVFGQPPVSQFGAWGRNYVTDLLASLMHFRLSNLAEHRVALTGGDWHASMSGRITPSSIWWLAQQKTPESDDEIDQSVGIDFMVSSGITNICTKDDMTNVTSVMKCQDDDIPGFCVHTNTPSSEPRRNYGVVYMDATNFGVENKFGGTSIPPFENTATLKQRFYSTLFFWYSCLETAWVGTA